MRVEMNNFMNSFLSFGMASPHITDGASSEFDMRKVSIKTDKSRLGRYELRSPGPVAEQTITIEVKFRIPFSESILRSG